MLLYVGIISSFKSLRAELQAFALLMLFLWVILHTMCSGKSLQLVWLSAKQFTMCLGVVAVLLLNVMDVFSVRGGALLDRPCMDFHRMCVLCP